MVTANKACTHGSAPRQCAIGSVCVLPRHAPAAQWSPAPAEASEQCLLADTNREGQQSLPTARHNARRSAYNSISVSFVVAFDMSDTRAITAHV